MVMMAMSMLTQRARESGICPPSLLSTDNLTGEKEFEETVLKVLDASSFKLSNEAKASEFAILLLAASGYDNTASLPPEVKAKTLEFRRSIILAIVAGTPVDNPVLEKILDDGYLKSVHSWMNDVLNSSVGGVDFLLHLLSCIAKLPVTKEVVKDSGMGKAIGSVEKNKFCKGPNEEVIKSRVQNIKAAWSASVKARKPKSQEAPSTEVVPAKRQVKVDAVAPDQATNLAKRRKLDDPKKGSSFSSLLKKISSAAASTEEESGSGSSSGKEGQANKTAVKSSPKEKQLSKKSSKRVKWADHFGGNLSVAQEVEGADDTSNGASEGSLSWSDRKKRDRLREKELLTNAKKSKLTDDEDEGLDVPKAINPTVSWRAPFLLPERADLPKPQLDSPETLIQNERIASVARADYRTEYDIPNSPTPLTDVEQALDMTSQSSAIITDIPFFVPQQPPPSSEPVQAAAYYDSSFQSQTTPTTHYNTNALTGATPEFVQALGLPLFLVGQDPQALQTIASSPGLLSTLVDATGMYDQNKLMSLVQTLSGSTNPGMTSFQMPANGYLPNAGASSYVPTTAPSTLVQSSGGYSGSSSSDGNLHISGYGPNTTQADIIALFSPYVRVDEVVMKGTFSFVNTSDPVNAQRAKEALTGTLLGGMPIRINPAQRKKREAATYGGGQGSLTSFGMPVAQPIEVVAPVLPPSMANNHVNIDSVRDDRGNPATKNLFVAGYGPGTTEEQLRALFSQHTTVIGVVLKGNFSFVNTTDRESAVTARNALNGTMYNGGVLRINFAKETGRLGTSFDLTYGPNTGPNARRLPQPQTSSYYGRGF